MNHIDLDFVTEYNSSGPMSLFERLHFFTMDLPAAWLTQLTFTPTGPDEVRISSDNQAILDSLYSAYLETL